MKAIVKTKSKNYKHLNGKTFQVVDILSNMVALRVMDEIGRLLTVDFGFGEVIIVDIDHEVQQAFNDWNWGATKTKYSKLKAYCKANGIETNEITFVYP